LRFTSARERKKDDGIGEVVGEHSWEHGDDNSKKAGIPVTMGMRTKRIPHSTALKVRRARPNSRYPAALSGYRRLSALESARLVINIAINIDTVRDYTW